MIKEITKVFDQAIINHIDRAKIGSLGGDRRDIKAFFKNHERKSVVIDKCFKQIEIAEKKSTLKFNVYGFQKLIEAAAAMFMDAAIEERNQKLLSENEKARRVKEHTRLDDFEEEMKEAGYEEHTQVRVFGDNVPSDPI